MSQVLLLPGLDGSNPLAFLAALGTLRVLTKTWSAQQVKMSWSVHNGTWSPTLHFRHTTDQATMTDDLFSALKTDTRQHPIAFMQSMHDAEPACIQQMFRDRASHAQAADRDSLDWLSAMSSDLATESYDQKLWMKTRQ